MVAEISHTNLTGKQSRLRAFLSAHSALGMTGAITHYLFLLSGARPGGNSETLARQAAERLPGDAVQTWLSLLEQPLPPFVDIRHSGDGIYSTPEGTGRLFLEATLAATDLVFVAPLYWYGLPTAAKLYLDHWSGWMRIPGLDFKPRMAGKRIWAVTVYSDTDPALAEPLFATLRHSARYMGMDWAGSLLGFGNRPGDILQDRRALDLAQGFFHGDRAEAT